MGTIFGDMKKGRAGFGLLILRVVFGLALAQHGWMKFHSPHGPFAWMGPGAGTPPIFQFLAAFSEFGGGLAVAVGLLTPLALLGIAITMVVAIVKVHLGHPWVSMDPKREPFESALGYLGVAVALLFTGPGAYSLDALLWNRAPAALQDRFERATDLDDA